MAQYRMGSSCEGEDECRWVTFEWRNGGDGRGGGWVRQAVLHVMSRLPHQPAAAAAAEGLHRDCTRTHLLQCVPHLQCIRVAVALHRSKAEDEGVWLRARVGKGADCLPCSTHSCAAQGRSSCPAALASGMQNGTVARTRSAACGQPPARHTPSNCCKQQWQQPWFATWLIPPTPTHLAGCGRHRCRVWLVHLENVGCKQSDKVQQKL